MITLDTIEICGFRSFIEPITYNFNNPGINVIQGKNGSGKTTITNDALAWVVWKKLVKPTKTSFHPWPHIIDDKYIGTMVSLKWHDEKGNYQIIRCAEYRGKVMGKIGKNRLVVLENGKELFEGIRDKKDQEKWIQNKIGYSFDLFKSTVLFAQELDRLMQEDGSNKKQIFDEAFESTFIQRARTMAEARLKDEEIELFNIQSSLRNIRVKYKAIREQVKQAKRVDKDFKNRQRERINKILDTISGLNEVIAELSDKLKKLPELGGKLQILNRKLKKVKLKIDKDAINQEFKLSLVLGNLQERLEKATREYESAKEEMIKPNVICSKCGSKLPDNKIKALKKSLEEKAKNLKLDIKIWEDSIVSTKADYKEAQKSVEVYKQVEKTINRLMNKIKIVEKEMDSLSPIKNQLESKKEWIKEKEKEIILIEKEKAPSLDLLDLKDKRSKISTKLQEILGDLKECKKKVKITQWLMKEPLSNSGLKTFIFDSMLGKLNNYLRKYTQLVGFEIRVYVDMDMANKPIAASVTKQGDEVPYEDLSKGQKQLVNVALAFSLNDVVNAAKPINILILDELFESLDEENLEAVGNIILLKSKNKCIHLITHQSKFSPTNATYTFVNQNKRGQSYITNEA